MNTRAGQCCHLDLFSRLQDRCILKTSPHLKPGEERWKRHLPTSKEPRVVGGAWPRGANPAPLLLNCMLAVAQEAGTVSSSCPCCRPLIPPAFSAVHPFPPPPDPFCLVPAWTQGRPSQGAMSGDREQLRDVRTVGPEVPQSTYNSQSPRLPPLTTGGAQHPRR